MKWSVITLFGRVMNNNVELSSDWLFHSAAHFSSSHSKKETQRKYIFQYFLSQLYRWVIILYIKCGHQGAAINMRGIETAFECTIAFYCHFRDLQSHMLCVNYSGSTYHTFYNINIYFHDLSFSLLSSLVYSQYLQNFWWFGCAGSAGGWHRTWAGICKCWGCNYSRLWRDPDCNVTVGVMFWVAYFSVVFCLHEIYIRRSKQWC